MWNLRQDRWVGAVGLLDFYHASQQVRDLGRVVAGEKQPALTHGVEPRLHDLRHGRDQQVLGQTARLKQRAGAAVKTSARTELFCHPCPADELPGAGPEGLAPRLWGRGIGVSAEAMPLQKVRTVLDGLRSAQSRRAG